MAVTAFILVGTGHPNETSIDAQWIIKLWEGSTANWVASPIGSDAPNQESRPKSPDEILAVGCKFAQRLAREHDLDSVAICTLDESSIAPYLARTGEMLTDVNLHLMRSVGSRTTSQWREGSFSTGELSE